MTVVLIILAIVFAAAGAAAYVRCRGLQQRLNESERARNEMAERVAEADRQLAESERVRNELTTSLAVARQQLADEQSLGGERLKAMAAELLDATHATRDAAARAGIEALLSPVKQSLETFTRDFKACYDTDRYDRATLRESIESLAKLNTMVSRETGRLTHALKGDKGFQGRWGEMVLANILEHAGLERSRWVCYQSTTTTDDGRQVRPDAVITLPRGRSVIIDSKCSLSAYMEMVETDDAARRKVLEKTLVQAVDYHIKSLAGRNYQDTVGDTKGNFVVLFMPHEGAYAAAMQADERLWQRAFDARIIIASPTHLATLIKLVEQMWIGEDRNANARLIAEEAVKMLDKLTGAFDDLTRVGAQLDKARDAYDAAVAKLRTGPGNVTRRVGRLAELGVKSAKAMPAQFTPDED